VPVEATVGSDSMLKGWWWGWCLPDSAGDDEGSLNGGLGGR
jgi:hypothetical protein